MVLIGIKFSFVWEYLPKFFSVNGHKERVKREEKINAFKILPSPYPHPLPLSIRIICTYSLKMIKSFNWLFFCFSFACFLVYCVKDSSLSKITRTSGNNVFLIFAKDLWYLHYMEVSWTCGIFYGCTKSHKEVHGSIHSGRNTALCNHCLIQNVQSKNIARIAKAALHKLLSDRSQICQSFPVSPVCPVCPVCLVCPVCREKDSNIGKKPLGWFVKSLWCFEKYIKYAFRKLMMNELTKIKTDRQICACIWIVS